MISCKLVLLGRKKEPDHPKRSQEPSHNILCYVFFACASFKTKYFIKLRSQFFETSVTHFYINIVCV